MVERTMADAINQYHKDAVIPLKNKLDEGRKIYLQVKFRKVRLKFLRRIYLLIQFKAVIIFSRGKFYGKAIVMTGNNVESVTLNAYEPVTISVSRLGNDLIKCYKSDAFNVSQTSATEFQVLGKLGGTVN